MAKLKIRGRISYMPGPWGGSVSANGANIKLIDLHPIKGTKQTVWTGTTNAQGRFSGTTAEWHDQIILVPAQPPRRTPFGTIPGTPAVRGPDPTDVLMLVIEITLDGRTYSYPFPFIGDNIEVPVILPFGPASYNANRDRATLNGAEFTNMQQVFAALMQRVEQKQPIELKLYGAWADAVAPLVGVLRQTPLSRARTLFPQSRTGSLSLVVGGVTLTISSSFLIGAATLVIALVPIIIAGGVVTFMACMGIVLILAVLNGYEDIGARQDSTTGADGSTTTETTISIGRAQQAPPRAPGR
jgi:hypothetical protein